MDGPSRIVLIEDNEPLVRILRAKREELLAEAKLNYVQTIDSACRSLCDHRTAITTRQEARKLKHVGNWVLKLLEPFFEERTCAPTQQPVSEESLGTNMTGTNGRAKRKYCPTKNSAGYALLITLLRAYQSGKEFMKRAELIDEAERSGLSIKPIRENAIGWGGHQSRSDFYSGWSSMNKTLIPNFLVVKFSKPAKYKLTDEGKLVAQECLDKSGLNQDNGSGLEMTREVELRVSPARQESAECSSGRQEPSSSDEDVQEIRRSDLTSQDKRRRRNNVHISSSQPGMRVDDLPSAPSKPNFLGNSSLQAPPVTSGTDITAKADNRDFLRNNHDHYSMSAAHVQSNVTVEIGSVDPDFELAVPPLEAGAKFSDVYEIVCILDTREKFGRQIDTQLQKFADSLMAQFNVKVEIRGLPVGDALWIARHKQQNEEYVLEFVVERKNVDDLWSSIKDNRYKQQKLRLMNCGLKCLLYLVEGDVNKVESTDALKTAMFTTELQGGFRLLKTDDTNDTRRQYGNLTKAIISRYDMETGKVGKSGQVCKTYKAFLEHCKDFDKDRVKDVFCRQLTQIGQVTEEIARSIQDRYPTLLSIAKSFEELEGNQGAQEKLLQGIPIRNTSKTIGAVMSKNIYKAIWAP